MTAEQSEKADGYIDGKDVRETSKVGTVDTHFNLDDRIALSVSEDGLRNAASVEEALLVSSETRDGCHKPVIDIDIPARLVPSSTPGHSHLYLDVTLSWDEYEALLVALNAAGIIETGYLLASHERQATHVRLPWVTKTAPVGAES